MKFPAFPTIEGYPCTDPDLYWGYACLEHVDLREFRERAIEQHASGDELPGFIYNTKYPDHVFVSWQGFGGWSFCFPDDPRAKPITFWAADTCTYTEWLEQMLKDICNGRGGCDEKALRIIHTLQMFRNGGYIPFLDAMYAPAPSPMNHPIDACRHARLLNRSER